MKKFIVALAVALFTAVSVLGVYKFISGGEKETEHPLKGYKIPTIEELGISDKINENSFGLYFYDNGRYVNIAKETVNVDLDKPIKIHTHGMNYETGYTDVSTFPEKEYWTTHNIFIFRWSPFADNVSAKRITTEEWSKTPGTMFAYPGPNGERLVETVDVPPYSIAEIYAAHYYQLMKTYDFKTNDIHFSGHSMGGQLTVALASYLITMVEAGALEKEYMPSRFTLLDPYMDNLPYNTVVDWLGEPIGKDGAAEILVKTANKLSEYGIPMEYILSGGANAAVLATGEVQMPHIMNATTFMTLNTDYLNALIDDMFNKGSAMHQAAVDWYLQSKTARLYDTATNSTSYALTAGIPFEYSFSMKGHKFGMESTVVLDPTQSVMYSTAKKTGIVAGYAFTDVNGNGKHDETLKDKKAGVTVELYANGELIGSAVTNKGGYYQFEVPQAHANKALEIRVSGEFSVTGTGETANKIGSTGKYSFTLQNKLQTVLVNIGFQS